MTENNNLMPDGVRAPEGFIDKNFSWVKGLFQAAIFFGVSSFGVFLLAGWKWSLVYLFAVVGLFCLVMAGAEYVCLIVKEDVLNTRGKKQ